MESRIKVMTLRLFPSLLLLLLTVVEADDAHPIIVRLALSKSVFEPGETILLTVEVRPVGEGILEVGDGFFVCRKNRLQLFSPYGQLYSRASDPRRPSTPFEWIDASKTRPATIQIELTSMFPRTIGYKEPHCLDILGEYHVRYGGEIYVRRLGSGSEPWRGDVRSNEVRFRLVRPSQRSVEAAILALSRNDTTGDRHLRAIETVRFDRGKRAFQAIAAIATNTNAMERVRVAAIDALAEQRTPEAFHVLSTLLPVADGLVRAVAIAGIGGYSTREAMQLILREYESGKTSSSRAAMVVLLQKGDESALPILESLAKRHQDPWVRETAQRRILEITKKPSPKRQKTP